MRLDFNVLWIEDQQGNVQAQRERIERLIKNEGFRLQVRFASSLGEATACLSEDIYGDHIDLILMDYDLGAGGRGDDGLVQIRNIFSYKDIIFYSSQATDLLDMVAAKKVQGVFCSTRENLTDTVVGAFDSLVKKVLDIDHSRGIVMGATSDIDQFVNDCLHALFERSETQTREETLKVIARHMKDKRKSFDKDSGKVEAVTHVSELGALHNIYTSNDRLRLLKNALKLNNSKEDKIEAINQYLTETVQRRNLLAHVRVEVDGFSRKLVDSKGIEFTSADMKDLRFELLRYQLFFEELFFELKQ